MCWSPQLPPAFLALQGFFKVGLGDPVQDVRKARQLIGIRSSRLMLWRELRWQAAVVS